jgi:hypothetical protein
VLYRALLIGTDLAAATRPLHWKDTGNPTRDLVPAPTRHVVVIPGPMSIASGIKARRAETVAHDCRPLHRARFTRARPCDIAHCVGLGSQGTSEFLDLSLDFHTHKWVQTQP